MICMYPYELQPFEQVKAAWGLNWRPSSQGSDEYFKADVLGNTKLYEMHIKAKCYLYEGVWVARLKIHVHDDSILPDEFHIRTSNPYDACSELRTRTEPYSPHSHGLRIVKMDEVYHEDAWYWLSSESMTVAVSVNSDGIITRTPAIVYKFVGQPLDNLRKWMRKQGGFREGVLR